MPVTPALSTADLGNLNRAVVYVEDAETASFLGKLFTTVRTVMEFVPAGGFMGVATRLQEVRTRTPTVKAFGLVDRDYRPDRSAKWQLATTRTFQLKRHEIENYALDWVAIASLAAQQGQSSAAITPTAVESYACQIANDYLYTVACNSYLAELERVIYINKPHEMVVYPKPASTLTACEQKKTLLSLAAAINYLDQSKIVNLVRQKAPTALSLSGLTTSLNGHVTTFRAALNGGSPLWQEIYPGKEILRAIRCRWFAQMNDEDFLKEIARVQVASNRIPSDLDVIVKAIQSRI